MNQPSQSMSTTFMAPDFTMYNAASMSRMPIGMGSNPTPSGYPLGSNTIPWAQMAQIQQQNHSQNSTFNLPLNIFPQANPIQGFSHCNPNPPKAMSAQSDSVTPSNTPRVELNPADEDKMILVLTTATRIEQNYRVALDGLDGVRPSLFVYHLLDNRSQINGIAKETWKTHYFVHKSRIDTGVAAQLARINIRRDWSESPAQTSDEPPRKAKTTPSPALPRAKKSSRDEFKDPISLSTRAKNPLNMSSFTISGYRLC
jgi:hypothetical protein